MKNPTLLSSTTWKDVLVNLYLNFSVGPSPPDAPTRNTSLSSSLYFFEGESAFTLANIVTFLKTFGPPFYHIRSSSFITFLTTFHSFFHLMLNFGLWPFWKMSVWKNWWPWLSNFKKTWIRVQNYYWQVVGMVKLTKMINFQRSLTTELWCHRFIKVKNSFQMWNWITKFSKGTFLTQFFVITNMHWII